MIYWICDAFYTCKYRLTF